MTTALRTVLRRDQRVCWLCHHKGANSLDHPIPRSLRPDLTWVPENWRAAHLHPAGRPGGCFELDCTCPGNTGRGAKPIDDTPTRRW